MSFYANPKKCETNIISQNINILFIDNNFKVLANSNIKKNDIILIEVPKFNLFGEKNNNMIIQMLYLLLKNKDDISIINLYPRNNIDLINLKNNPFILNLIKLINEYKDSKIKTFLLSFNKQTLYQYYYKYLFNAFDMYNSPAILPIGAMMNHSCNPNIKFYEKNNAMYFEALCNIKKGSELCYSYLRNYKFTSNKDKIQYLINHYNFICSDCNMNE